MRKQTLNLCLDFAIVALFISGLLDLGLWLVVEYMVPSWTISVIVFGFIGMILAIKYYVNGG